MDKIDYHKKNKIKREKKMTMDKKKDPVYKPNHSEVIEERLHKGFVLQVVECYRHGGYKVKSPYFKDGVFSINRRSIDAAFKQGEYTVHCVYNYLDIREEILNEDGVEFVLTGQYHSCKPWTEDCICGDKNNGCKSK